MGNLSSSPVKHLKKLPKRNKGAKGRRLPSRGFLRQLFNIKETSTKESEHNFYPDLKEEEAADVDLDQVAPTELLESVGKGRVRPPRKIKKQKSLARGNNEEQDSLPVKPSRPSLAKQDSSSKENDLKKMNDDDSSQTKSPPVSSSEPGSFLLELNSVLAVQRSDNLQRVEEKHSEQSLAEDDDRRDNPDAVHPRFECGGKIIDHQTEPAPAPEVKQKKIFLKPGAMFSKSFDALRYLYLSRNYFFTFYDFLW